MSDWQVITLEDGGLARVRDEAAAGRPVFLLLHGWTGNEFVMEPFTRYLPEGLWVAFRAPWPVDGPRGGYSWLPALPQGGAWVAHYQLALERLTGWLAELQARWPQANWAHRHWVGFSQGAAVALTWALHYPEQITTVSALAGFLPHGAQALAARRPLAGKAVFVAHGTEDEIVPVARARQTVELLRLAGARVTYCEDAVGHKASAACLRRWQSFWAEEAAAAPGANEG